MNFLNKFKKLKKSTKIIILCIAIVFLVILIPLIWYNSCISAINNQKEEIPLEIEIGSGTSKIASLLKQSGAIKNELAFKLYVKLNHIEGFQAGKYTLNASMDVNEIIEVLKTGAIMSSHTITFIEGKNMRWIANKIAEETKNTKDDVFNLLKDTSYIDGLINDYWFITEDVKNSNIYYPLEGYLFPDTYDFKSEDVTVKEIFKTMLDKMDSVLSKYKSEIEKSKYSVHELLSLASVVELEGIHASDRKDIASVMYNRLDSGMSLGSDVTTYYAYKIDVGERDLYTSELYTYNPYNTRGPEMFGKLPVGPIASVSQASIEAAIEPNNTGYLFFVADKNGKIYFTKTSSEHQKMVSSLKQQGLWFEY